MTDENDPLTELPNIGKELSQLLTQVGIHTPEELKIIGAEQAFLRINALDNTSCFSKLCALEGAVEGIRWHYLPSETKEKLRDFFKMTKKCC